MNEELRAFQKQFIRGALARGIDVAALSIPRGNGKSWLAAHLRGLKAAEDPILDVLKGGIDPDKMVVDVRTAEAVGLVIQSAIQRTIGRVGQYRRCT